MLPAGHVVIALGTTKIGRRAFPWLHRVDWRLVALAPLLPDVIDKSLAWLISPWLFSHAHTTRLVAHALLPSLALLVGTLLFRPDWLPYALAFGSHLIADRMWENPVALLWPVYGWTTFSGAPDRPQTALHVHGGDVMQFLPILLVELGALIILAWLARRYGLWRWQNLSRLLLSGRISR